MEAFLKDVQKFNEEETTKLAKQTQKDFSRAEKDRRKNVKDFFKKLDSNKDSKLDQFEFYEIVRSIGEIWTNEEIKAAISQIDRTNTGSINFGDFYYWWTKESDPKDVTRLNFLKMKLKSESYVKSLAEVAKEFVDAQLNQPSKPSTEVDFSVTVGAFKQTKSSLKVSASTNPAKYSEIVKLTGASNGDSCGFITFDLLPEVDLKVISDVVAKINLGLAFAKKTLPYDRALAQVETGPSGNKQLVISVVFSGKKQQKFTQLVKKTLADIDFSAEVAFDQSPSEPPSESELNMKFSIKGKVPHVVFRKENAKYIKKIPSIGRDLSEILTAPTIAQLVPLIEFGGFDLQIGGLTELVKSFANIDTKDVPEEEFSYYPVLNSWDAIREFLAVGATKTVFKEKKSRKHGLKFYFDAQKSIKSIAKVAVASEQTTLEVHFNNFDLMHVLPTKEFVGFDEKKGEEPVVDDIKLLYFQLPKDPDADTDSDQEEVKFPSGPAVILSNNALHHTFERDEVLVLEYGKGERFSVNHVMVKGSRLSKNPVKHAFFWAFDEKPTDASLDVAPFNLLEKFLKKDENDRLVVPEWPPKDAVDGLPFAHVELKRNEFYGESHLEKPVTGKYIVVAFPDSWECKRSRDKSTVQYVGFAGPAEKPKYKTSLLSKFGLK